MIGISVVVFVLAFGVHAQEAETFGADANPFGVVEAFWSPDAACEIGLGWERIIFDWSQIQPTSADDWNTLNVDERWIVAARECGREVVALVKYTPVWATDGTPGIGVPRGLSLPIDDADNLWAAFMARLATYYGERGVNRFIIWNEPDIPAGTYGYEFEGSVTEYAQMVRVASLAAKAANPVARVHLAGTTYWHDVNAGRRLYLDRLLEVLVAFPDAPAHYHFFDAVTLHIYFRADTVYTITQETRALLNHYGMGEKAIWIGEMNASPNRDPAWRVERPQYQVTLEQQSVFLIQAAALGLAGGASHIAVYKFTDGALPAGAEAFGLIRTDGSRRPAFETWTMIAQELRAVTTAVLTQMETVNHVHLTRADGSTVDIAWARTAAAGEIVIPAHTSNAAQLFDAYGNIMSLTASDEYPLFLPGAICDRRDGCAVGGSPALLVQSAL